MPIGTYFVVTGVEKFAKAASLAPAETDLEERRAMHESLLIVKGFALSHLHHRGGPRRAYVRTRIIGLGLYLEGRLHPAGVGAILEGGAKPHQERAAHASVLAFPAGGRAYGTGGEVFARSVHHPGITGKEFLKPALEEAEPLIQERFNTAANRLAAFLEKA